MPRPRRIAIPAETRRIDMQGDALYLEVDVDASDRLVAVRAVNDTGWPARCRLTVSSGTSAGRTTGWRTIPVNQGAVGEAVLSFAIPTGAAQRLQLAWDAVRQRYTNLEKEIQTRTP